MRGMNTRAYIPLKVQLAAALLQIRDAEGRPAITHEHAKLMTADQVISLFQRDHYPIRKENGGPDLHWNLMFLFIGAHRAKTSTIDVPQSAKVRRLSAGQEDFRTRVLARPCGEKRQTNGRWPKQKLRSRSSFGQRQR